MKQYKATDKLRNIINDNSSLLMVMSRFGIPLGFGDKTVKEVCEEQSVDSETFLAVANFSNNRSIVTTDISLSALIDYLKRAHTYFLDFSLPTIRRRLLEAIDCSGADDVAFLILKFYDEYVGEVRAHMQYENDEVFTYVEELLSDRLNADYTIATFANKHNDIAPKLKELKNIIIGYYPLKENDLLNSVLFDIINCEQDLTTHCLIEDALFVPTVEALERELKAQGKHLEARKTVITGTIEDKNNTLSDREKEIIGYVAKGKSNKEIADALCISVHTVTTHRRNIATKLQIHSPAGLTIYAIVNKIVRLQDLNLS